MRISEIIEGEKVEGLVCTIKSFQPKSKDIELILMDQEKEIGATVSKNLYDIRDLNTYKGKALLIDGLVVPGLEGIKRPSIKIKFIQVSEDESDKESVLAHIDKGRLDFYLERIKKYAEIVKTPFYRALINALFTNDNIELMKRLPATHTRQGSPSGGMLHATCAVLEMAMQSAMCYLYSSNQVYSFYEQEQLDLDLIVTGALFHLSGNFIYFDTVNEPFVKNVVSIEAGFSECRTEYINELIVKNHIDVDRGAYCALLGVMAKLNEQGVGVKQCRREAVLLLNAYQSFMALDAFDEESYKIAKKLESELSDEEETEKAFYSERLDCYISQKEIEIKRQIIKKRGEKDAV